MFRIFTIIFTLGVVLISSDALAQNTWTTEVFDDLNRDGDKTGDPLIAGIPDTELLLWQDVNMDGLPNTGGDVAFTYDAGMSAGGIYVWNNAGAGLPDGNYILEYNQVGGTGTGGYWISIVGGGGANDNDVNPSTGFPSLSVLVDAANPNEVDVDLGLFTPVVVETFIWDDTNGNGVQEGGEPGIPGIADGTFTLLDENTGAAAVDGLGNPVVWADMGGGVYEWQNVVPSDYHIIYVNPLNSGVDFYTTRLDQGGDDTVDSDSDPNNGYQTISFTVFSGDTEDTFDAGYFIPATITTFVWNDANGDGIQDAGEAGITGEAGNFQLWDNIAGAQVNDVFGTPITGAELGAAGEYTFENVPPGSDYYIQYVIPTDPGPGPYVVTQLDQGGDDTLDSDVDEATLQSALFDVVSDGDEEDVDAGFILPARITCFVWEDANGDGLQDGAGPPAEDGIPGATATLFENDGVTAALDITGAIPVFTATGTPGEYEFANLAPGEYIVQFDVPPSPVADPYFPTVFDDDGMNTDANDMGTDSDADPDNTLQSYVIELEAEENEERVDAGFYVPGKIGNQVFCDKDGNGLFDAIDLGEAVANVTVTLINNVTGEDPALDANGMALVEVTDAGGLYEFELVPPSLDYTIRFTTPGGFEITRQDVNGDIWPSDVDNDSDVSAITELSESFELYSRDDMNEIENHDCGMFQPITIQGTVWLDDGMNNTYDGEPGVGGVVVRLFRSIDLSTPIDMSTTSGMGLYMFEDVAPGTYVITIASSNFADGLPLAGTESCEGVVPVDGNVPVDNDDNGSDGTDVETNAFTLLSSCDPANPPVIEHIDFCFGFDCSTQNSLAEPECETTEDMVICNLPDLTGFCSRMFESNSGGNQPTPLCPGQSNTGAHNISWFAFVAPPGNYTLEIDPFACAGSSNGNEGVQIGVYTSCDFTDAVFCNGNCNLATVSIQSSDFEPGATYYIFIDGCNGSVCSYSIEILGDIQALPDFGADDLCIGTDPATALCEDITICEGSPTNFVLSGLDLEIEYTWSVTTNSGGPYNGETMPETSLPALEVTFDAIGEYTVCAESATNGCTFWTNGALCRTVTVVEIQNEDFDTVFVCQGEADQFDPSLFDGLDPNMDGTTGWQAGDQTWVASPAGTLNSYEVTIPNGEPLAGCIYEQFFVLREYPEAPTFDLNLSFCRDELPFLFNSTEYDFNIFGGVNIYVQPNIMLGIPTVNGCDSTVDLTLELLDIEAVPITPSCTVEGIVIGYELPPYPGDWDLEFLWSGPTGPYAGDNDTDGNPATVIADQGTGVYNLSIRITKTLPDGTTKICTVPQGLGIVIDEAAYIPMEPNLDGPMTVCAGSTSVYTATSSSVGVTYSWDPPGGVSADSSGDDNETLTVQWGTSTGGIILVTSMNECGESEPANLTVSVVPQPTGAMTVDPIVCQDSISVIEFVGDPSMVSDFTWMFSGGSIENGTGGSGPGPHNVSWPTPGVKYITMSFEDNNGCISETVLDSVTVEAPLPAPVVTCQQTGAGVGEVIFTWTDIPGASYSFEITNPGTEYATAMIVNNTVVVTGVDDGVLINLILTTTTTNACSILISDAVACPAQSCMAPMVVLATEISELCLNNIDSLQQQITVTITPTPDPAMPGTTVFSGPGVDAVTGMFDASAAGPGDHTIAVVYTDADGCVGGANTSIIVKEVPVASFTFDPDSVCITDGIAFTYTGTENPTQFIWDFGTNANATGAMGPTPMVEWTTAGTKTVRLTVVKDGCTSETITNTVKVQPLLEDLVVTCIDQEDTSVTFGWNAVDGAAEYIVVIDGGTPMTQTGTTILVDGLTPLTEVNITVTSVPAAGILCPGSPDSTSCVALDCPDFSFENQTLDTIVCEGTGLSLIQLEFEFTNEATGMPATGFPTYNGNLNVDPTTGLFDPNGLPAGEYLVQITFTEQPTMCTAPGSVRIIVLEQPDAQFTVSETDVCINSTEASVLVNFTGVDVSGTALPWNASGGSTIEPTANANEYEWTFTMEGVYTLDLTLTNGDCDSIAIQQTVNVTVPEIIQNFTCQAADFGDIDLSWDAADCAAEYFILVDGVAVDTITGTTYTVEDLSAGDHTFAIQATSTCDCDILPATTNCEALECTPEDIGEISCTPGDFGEIEISWTGVPCAIEYTIFVDGNEVATQTGTTYTAVDLFEGLHSFVVTASSSCECDIIDGMNLGDCEATGCPEVEVTSITAMTQDWCLDSDDLNPVSIDVVLSGDDGTGTVTWDGGNDDGTFDPSGQPVGVYEVIYAYQETGCGIARDTIEFTIFGSPSITPVTQSPDCYTSMEGLVSFEATGGVEPYTILVDGDPSSLDEMTISAGAHTVEIMDANGCASMATFAIVVPDPLSFDESSISGNREVILNGDGTFTIDPSIAAGVTVDSIEWMSINDGTVYCSGTDCFAMTQTFTADDSIMVTIFYNNGCAVETTFAVTVRSVTIVDISNVFTPNGDGTNESFVIFTNSADIIFTSVQIYDRWGNLVKFDPGWTGPGTHEVWDGRFAGSAVQPGVYIYTAEFTEGGVPRRRTGDITLVR